MTGVEEVLRQCEDALVEPRVVCRLCGELAKFLNSKVAATGLIEAGSNLYFVAFSAWRSVLKSECRSSLETLGVKEYEILNFPRRHFPEKRQEILQYLYDLNQERNFDLVLTPSINDLHQDHLLERS